MNWSAAKPDFPSQMPFLTPNIAASCCYGGIPLAKPHIAQAERNAPCYIP
jgi:hypothetical protein